MTRNQFGGNIAEFVTVPVGADRVLKVASSTLTFWRTQSGDDQVTDLRRNGQAVTEIPVPANGTPPVFDGPDDDTLFMWASAGGGSRLLMFSFSGLARAAALLGTTNDALIESLIKQSGSKTQVALSAAIAEAIEQAGAGGTVIEDPADPGTFIVTGSALTEDPADPGTYLIGA